MDKPTWTFPWEQGSVQQPAWVPDHSSEFSTQDTGQARGIWVFLLTKQIITQVEQLAPAQEGKELENFLQRFCLSGAGTLSGLDNVEGGCLSSQTLAVEEISPPPTRKAHTHVESFLPGRGKCT